ncbi:MAG: TolC family protein [Chitinophagaceae bacterium]|nr:MAG: TolC family protein [Chitinophagaceae bacterium]
MKIKILIRRVLPGVALLALFAAKAGAQEVRKLTLPDAIRYALENYTSARKAKLDLENAGYQIDEVRAKALPQVSGSGALNYNPLLQLSALPGELNPTNPGQTLLVAFGQKWNSNIGVSATQAIFDQSVFTGLKAAKTTREFYQLNSQLTEENIIEQVAVTYYNVLVQRQQISDVDSNIASTTRSRTIIAGLFESGLGKEIDVDRTDVQLSNLRSQRQQLLNTVVQYENQLKFYIGMPISAPIEVPDMETAEMTVNAAELSDTINSRTRTEYRVLAKQADLLRLQKQNVKAAYYPSLSFSGSYNYQGLSDKFPIAGGKSGGANWFDVGTVGLNLKIPLFNGNATRARVRQAEIEIKQLEEDIRNTNLNIDLENENARTQIRNSLIVLGNQERNVKLAEKVMNNTQNNFNEGLAPLTDLIESQNQLATSRNSYTAALLDYKLAEISLIKSKGQLKTLINK